MGIGMGMGRTWAWVHGRISMGMGRWAGVECMVSVVDSLQLTAFNSFRLQQVKIRPGGIRTP